MNEKEQQLWKGIKLSAIVILAIVIWLGGAILLIQNIQQVSSQNIDNNNTIGVAQTDTKETEEERQERLKKEQEEKEKKEAEEKAKKEQEEKEKEELKEKEEKEFKAKCKSYTYQEMARNPGKFKGTNVKLTGEVVQVLYGTSSVDLRVNITKEGTYSTYYTDTVYVTYYPEEGEDRVLEDDIITIYGTAQGDYSYTSTIGAQVTLPLIYGKYITIK